MASRMRQFGDTCVIASGLFSAASRHRTGEPVPLPLLLAIDAVMQDPTHYSRLEKRLSAWGPASICQFIEFAGGHGYAALAHRPNQDSLRRAIGNHPVVLLKFDFPGWVAFYGQGSLNYWYSGHAICGLGITNGCLEYFEPLAGEIRTVPLDALNGKYSQIITFQTA